MSPSASRKAGVCSAVDMEWKGRQLLQTHRPPGPLQGYLPVTLTCSSSTSTSGGKSGVARLPHFINKGAYRLVGGQPLQAITHQLDVDMVAKILKVPAA